MQIFKKKKFNLVEFLPSISWLFFMFFPFILQINTFDKGGKYIQFFSITYFLILLLFSDFVAFRLSPFNSYCLLDSKINKSRFIDLISVLLLVPILFHLYVMPSIPILEWFMNQDFLSQKDIAILRESSTHIISFPLALNYFINWELVIFFPLAIYYLIYSSRIYLAFIFCSILIFYSLATTAKFPLVEILFSFSILVAFTNKYLNSGLKSILKVFTFLFLASFVFVIFLKGFDQKFEKNYLYFNKIQTTLDPEDPRQNFTLADSYRSNFIYAEKPLDFNYFFYRIWLTPVDVSYRWYQYFIYVDDKKIGFSNLLPFNRSVSESTLAKKVGFWAFKFRFPDRYLDSVSANSSFDADIFARFGFMGLLFAPFIFVFLRIFAAIILCRNILSIMSYAIFVGMLSIFPIIAPIQSIIGSHGLFVPILIMFFCKLNQSRWGRL
jgi:hypothetical protein